MNATKTALQFHVSILITSIILIKLFCCFIYIEHRGSAIEMMKPGAKRKRTTQQIIDDREAKRLKEEEIEQKYA